MRVFVSAVVQYHSAVRWGPGRLRKIVFNEGDGES